MQIDKKAQRILFNCYWGPGGWKIVDRFTTGVRPSEDDFVYAKAAKYMFDPKFMTHDQVACRLIELGNKASLRDVGNAFVASLSSRRLDLRSALSSYALARRFPSHEMDVGRCRICGISRHQASEAVDLNVLNFERLKWGGVRLLDPIYAVFDLDQFIAATQPKPSGEDFEILRTILKAAKSLPEGLGAPALSKAIAPLIKSNPAERKTLIEILAIAGVFIASGHKGFLDGFVPDAMRQQHLSIKSDWDYPAICWRSQDGVNDHIVQECFPEIADALN